MARLPRAQYAVDLHRRRCRRVRRPHLLLLQPRDGARVRPDALQRVQPGVGQEGGRDGAQAAAVGAGAEGSPPAARMGPPHHPREEGHGPLDTLFGIAGRELVRFFAFPPLFMLRLIPCLSTTFLLFVCLLAGRIFLNDTDPGRRGALI